MNALEPPLHRPRRCPGCNAPSTAIVDDACLACRTPDGFTIPQGPRLLCGLCDRPLLLTRPDRVRCERCRLDHDETTGATL